MPARAPHRSAAFGHPRERLAFGLSPSELSDQVLRRAATVPEGAVARLYLEGVDPEAYRLLDRHLLREVAAAALDLRLEPQFQDISVPAELPRVETPWEASGLLPDPPGPDRSGPRRVRTSATATSRMPWRRPGNEPAGITGTHSTVADRPHIPAQLPGIRRGARAPPAAGAGRRLRAQRRRQIDVARVHPVDVVGQARTGKEEITSAGTHGECVQR